MIWKKKANKTIPVAVAKELMESLKASIERGDEPPIGRTEKQVPGFRGRSGRNFRAKLKIEPREDAARQVEGRLRRGVGQGAAEGAGGPGRGRSLGSRLACPDHVVVEELADRVGADGA